MISASAIQDVIDLLEDVLQSDSQVDFRQVLETVVEDLNRIMEDDI